ncbi:MAG: hypothetical protein ACR2JI_03155 [Mycobacterium sp.]
MAAPSHLSLTGHPAGRRRLRRVSRQFAAVGVNVPAERLRQIAAGHPASESEQFDIAFAEAAIRITGEQRHSKRFRVKRRLVHSLVVTGAIVVAMNILICLGLVFIMMAAHTSPF